jgi:hypothetical protein
MVTLPKILTLAKLYSYHTNNPLGANEDEVLESLQVMYVEWRAVEGSPKVEELEEDVISDFTLPISSRYVHSGWTLEDWSPEVVARLCQCSRKG